MKIYDLDHLETISDDDTAIGGREEVYWDINMNVNGTSHSGSLKITIGALNIGNYNTSNTVSSSTGIAAPTWKPRLNLIKTLGLIAPSALKGIAKVITAASLILKPKLLATRILA